MSEVLSSKQYTKRAVKVKVNIGAALNTCPAQRFTNLRVMKHVPLSVVYIC